MGSAQDTPMHGGRVVGTICLAAAAGVVLWVRLVPLHLPAVEERAVLAARQRHAVAVRALDMRSAPALSPEQRTARVERAVDRWIATHPVEFAREVEADAETLRAQLRASDDGGRSYVLLGDLDSYFWLRAARAVLRTGTTCDAVVDGECRDTATLAPIGTVRDYRASLHIAAIVAVHRLATWLNPHHPLPVSSYWVPVVIGVLGVVPAFAIANRLAGPIGGLVAAVVSALHPVLLQRSLGSDNDVWNVVLPLYMVWAVIEGLTARRWPAQIVWAMAGGVAAGLHAATWRGWVFGFVVVLVGLAATGALLALRWEAQTGERRRETGATSASRLGPPSVSRLPSPVILVAVAYLLSTALCTAIAGAETSVLWVPLRAWQPLEAALWAPQFTLAPAAPTMIWPSALDTVTELWRTAPRDIADHSYGLLPFFVGWLGLLLLSLPRSRWRAAHVIVLIAGALLFWYLLIADIERRTLMALLALLLVVAVVARALTPADAADADAGPAMLVVVWLLAALFASFDGYRFILLLAPPLGITTGVVVGRLHLWLDARARRQLWLRPRLARTLAALACVALIAVPVRTGYAAAAAYVPLIDRAWVDTLESLRTTTPPQTIVNAWWDFGYWIAYYAERRVSADGGLLMTRVPFWLARAQLAPNEALAAGLLRMLNCGSDPSRPDDRKKGAYGKLLRAGLDEPSAAQMVIRLAPLARADADALLTRHGLEAAARADVLAATHCNPPESYLVMTTDQTEMPGWWYLGTWDPGRSYLMRVLRQRPKAEAVAALHRLGYDDAEARRLYRRARRLEGSAQLDDFVAPRGRFITASWARCAREAGGEWRCPVGAAAGDGWTIDAVIVPGDAPGRAELELHTGDAAAPSRVAPQLVLLAGPHAVEEIAPPGGAAEPLAVLLDGVEQRALVGTPTALRSTYTALMLLEGRYTKYFRKVDDRTGYRGERVVTWRIEWDADAMD